MTKFSSACTSLFKSFRYSTGYIQLRAFSATSNLADFRPPHSVYKCAKHTQIFKCGRSVNKVRKLQIRKFVIFSWFADLKVVTSEKIGGSGVTSTLGTWYGGVVMGVLLSFNEAAILDRDFNSAPSEKQNILVFAANNSRWCECYVAPTIIL